MDESEEMSRVNGWIASVDSRAFNQRPGHLPMEKETCRASSASELAVQRELISLNWPSGGVVVLLLL
jgi:hypothetical protein